MQQKGLPLTKWVLGQALWSSSKRETIFLPSLPLFFCCYCSSSAVLLLDVAHIVASFELLPFTFIRLSKSPSRFLLCHYATIVAAGHFHLQFLGVCKEHKKASNAILGAQVTTVMPCKCNQFDDFLEILKKAIIVMALYFFFFFVIIKIRK